MTSLKTKDYLALLKLFIIIAFLTALLIVLVKLIFTNDEVVINEPLVIKKIEKDISFDKIVEDKVKKIKTAATAKPTQIAIPVVKKKVLSSNIQDEIRKIKNKIKEKKLKQKQVTTPKPTAVPIKEKIVKKTSLSIKEKKEKVASLINAYEIPGVNAIEIASAIVDQSKIFKIDPFLITAIIYIESTFKKSIQSSTGKIGLMQIDKSEARKISRDNKFTYLGDATLKHPKVNIKVGVFKLQNLLNENSNDLEISLKKYNSSLSGNPELAKAYALKIIDLYEQYKRF